MAPSIADFADHWRALAKEALEVADAMTDPETEEQMWRIALWYERLAKHAEMYKGIAAHAEGRKAVAATSTSHSGGVETGSVDSRPNAG